MDTIEFPVTAQKVRTDLINNDLWFHLGDVCKILNLTNPSDVANRLENELKTQVFNDGGRDSWFIDEEALYTITLRCRDALEPGTIAYQFRKWVIVVIKTIRKTGTYGTTPEQQHQTEKAFDGLDFLNKLNQTQEQLVAELQQAIANQATHEKINALATSLEAVRKTKGDFQDKSIKLPTFTALKQKESVSNSELDIFLEQCFDFSDPDSVVLQTDLYRMYGLYSTGILDFGNTIAVSKAVKPYLQKRLTFVKTKVNKVSGRFVKGVKLKSLTELESVINFQDEVVKKQFLLWLNNKANMVKENV